MQAFFDLCRSVSTDRQADSGLWLVARNAKIRALADLHEFSLVRIFEGKAAGGKSLNRLGMIKMLDLIARAEAGIRSCAADQALRRSTAI